jgi:glucokinase
MKLLAVDLGGSHATCALVSDMGVPFCSRLELEGLHGLDPALPGIARALRSAAQEAAVELRECAGVAFSFCGLVDPVRKRVISTNAKYDDAPDIDLTAWAAAEFGLPLRLENDARMALLGERQAGAARGFDDVVMMTLGTGIGGAAMMQGRLVRGRHFQAGCLGGHFLARYGGRPCTCGSVGCVEAEASTWALPALCREHPGFQASSLAAHETIGFELLLRHAAAGDKCALDVLDHCAGVWEAAIVSLIHAYDPVVVVVGGGVMRAAGRLLPRFTEYAHRHAWTPWGRVQIRCAALGDDAALLGAIPLFEEACIEH